MTQDRKLGVYHVKLKWEVKGEIAEASAYWDGQNWRFVKHTPLDLGLPIKPENVLEVYEFLREKD